MTELNGIIIKLFEMKKLLLIFNIFLLISCSKDENASEIVDLRINHFQQTAVGLAQQLVIQIQEGDNIGSDDWSYLYSNIEGFDYESGFIYTLSVEKRKISNPLQDGSSNQYILRKVISKEKVDNEVTFIIQLKSVERSDPPSFITGSSSSNYRILDKIEIECNDLCGSLSEKLQTEDEVSGIFKHVDNNKISLINIISE